MNLKERLQNLKNGGESSDKPEEETQSPASADEGEKKQGGTMFQCNCGSHIRGECPECDAGESRVNESDGDGSDADIQARLDAIGGENAVNPPPIAGETEPSTSEPPAGLETCPYCAKAFKHLSRHKCKVGPKPEPEPATEPETKEEPTPEPESGEPVELDPNAPNISAILKAVGETVAKEHVRLLEFLEENLPIMASLPLDVKNCEVSVGGENIPQEKGFVLFIDCLFSERLIQPVHAFEGMIKPLGDAVARENQVPHWSTVDYGKGPGLLASKLERYLKAEKPTGAIVVDSSTAEARACLPVLKMNSDHIVFGIR